MSIKTCSVGGSVDDGGIVRTHPGIDGVTIVAPTNVAPLGDDNDATYIENTSGGVLDYNVRINALTSWSSGDPIFLHLRFEMDCDDHAATDGATYLFLQDGHPTDSSGDYYVAQLGSHWNTQYHLPGPYDGTIRDAVLPCIPRPSGTGAGYGVAGTTLDDVLTLLTGGDVWLNVNQVTVNDAGLTQARLIEAYLLVGVNTVVPSRLIYPRPTEGRRIYPPPPTQQAGRRTGTSSPL